MFCGHFCRRSLWDPHRGVSLADCMHNPGAEFHCRMNLVQVWQGSQQGQCLSAEAEVVEKGTSVGPGKVASARG